MPRLPADLLAEALTAGHAQKMADQIADIKCLLSERVNANELVEKWFEKAGAENWTEMPADAVAKCIDWLKSPGVATKKGAA